MNAVVTDTALAVSSFVSVILSYVVRIIIAVIISVLGLFEIIITGGKITNKHSRMKSCPMV